MEKIGIKDFQKRKLKEFYLAIYIAEKEIKIRTETAISNKKLYIMWGVDILGNRQVIGIYLERENDNRFWLEKFEDIQARNTKEIIFLVSPVNKNIERCAKIIYNNIRIIHSPDEITNSITKFLAIHPSRKMVVELKELYYRENKEEFEKEYKMFKEVYINNRILMIMLEKNKKSLDEYYEYNKELRKLFYPNYTFEEMKKYLNKLKTKEPLCKDLNEVIEFCLPLVNGFEQGRNYSKKEWLQLIEAIYDEYKEKLEVYLNG